MISETWKTALFTVRTQMADYEREGTSTPGKLKRAGRLRASRMAMREVAAVYGAQVNAVKLLLNEIEGAEKDDNWRKLGHLIRELLSMVDGMIGASEP